MAKDVKDSGNAGHNLVSRKEAIDDALKQVYALKKDIKEALAEHVKPLREEVDEIKSNLAEDYNLPKRVFNARYASYEIEADAIASKDDITLDAMRELYEAAPVGEQMDWVKAQEAA